MDRAALVLIFGVALVFYASIQLHHDVAWYAYCNLRQLEGMRPYIDVIEVSPPITFYLTLPAAALAAWTGAPMALCIAAWMLGLTAMSLLIVSAIDRESRPIERRWKLVSSAAVLLILPTAVFAQREHFAAVLSLPYFYAAGLRARGLRISAGWAVLAGLTAGFGLSIKHYFLLAPFAVEAYLVITTGSLRLILRPELIWAVVAGVLHTAFVLVVHPEYLSVALPLIFAAYDAYSLPAAIIATQPWSLATTFGIVFWLIARRYVRIIPSADCLFVAAAAFYITIFLQAKGWAYQSLPARMLLALSSIEMIGAMVSGRASLRGLTPLLKCTLPTAPIALVLIQAIASGPYKNQLAVDAAPYIARHAPRGSVFVMSSKISAAFPMVLDARARWASRFSTKWILPAIIRAGQPGRKLTEERRQSLERLARWETDATIEDFRKFEPDIVFVDCTYRDTVTMVYGTKIDMIERYRRDPRFRDIWARYAMRGVLSSTLFGMPQRLEVWVRTDPGGTPAPSILRQTQPAGPPQDSRAHPSPERETPHEEK